MSLQILILKQLFYTCSKYPSIGMYPTTVVPLHRATEQRKDHGDFMCHG